MTFWVNGHLRPDDTSVAGMADRGFLLGDGLFETIKVSGKRPLFLTEHLCRLAVAAQEIGLPVDRSALREGLFALIKAADGPVSSARITVSRGPGPRGMAPIPMDDQSPISMITVVQDLPGVKAAQSPASPDRLLVAPFVRSSGSHTARMKTLSYADNLAAKAWATNEGAADVIFLNERGDVTSTTMANLFVETSDGFITPPLSAGILPGIVREVLLRTAPRHGVNIQVKRLSMGDLWSRRLFRTNSLLGVRPAWLDYGRGAKAPVDKDDGILTTLYRTAEREQDNGAERVL
ncbi:MAG: aminotransferase class IV [Pseudomonadota bacterium]